MFEGEALWSSVEDDGGAVVWPPEEKQQNANSQTVKRWGSTRRGDCMAGVLSPNLQDDVEARLTVADLGF